MQVQEDTADSNNGVLKLITPMINMLLLFFRGIFCASPWQRQRSVVSMWSHCVVKDAYGETSALLKQVPTTFDERSSDLCEIIRRHWQ